MKLVPKTFHERLSLDAANFSSLTGQFLVFAF